MSAERWRGDVGDLRSDPVVDVFVDRFSKMLDGEYLTEASVQ